MGRVWQPEKGASRPAHRRRRARLQPARACAIQAARRDARVSPSERTIDWINGGASSPIACADRCAILLCQCVLLIIVRASRLVNFAAAEQGTAEDTMTMLEQTSKHARECLERAADCRRRAQKAPDANMQAFWRQQEARWMKLAESNDLSARLSAFLDVQDGKQFSPEAEEGVQTLVDIFDRVCRTLDLDVSEDTRPRKIARTIIEATLAGESDPDKLFFCGLGAVSH
jgi:hypothetical protein